MTEIERAPTFEELLAAEEHEAANSAAVELRDICSLLAALGDDALAQKCRDHVREHPDVDSIRALHRRVFEIYQQRRSAESASSTAATASAASACTTTTTTSAASASTTAAATLKSVQSDPVFQRGDHAELALVLCHSLHQSYSKLVFDEGRLRGYSRAIWEEISPARLSQIVQSYAGAIVDPHGKDPRVLRISRGDVTGASSNLYDRCAQPGFFADAPAGVAFEDSFAVVTADGIEPREHAAENRATFAYQFPLPKSTELPKRFLQFCNDTFGSDADAAEKILAIQEHLGACITGIAPRYERALLLVGEANTGKSRLTRIFEDVMPPGTVTGLPPSLMHDQYALPRLVGSRLNVVADIGREPIAAGAKGIISGERRTVRNPGSSAFDLIPRAGHIFAVNPPMPALEDTSSGFERRWVILTFNRVLLPGHPKRDPCIVERIIPAETAQIIRWGLEGAVRLLRQRGHTLPVSHDLAMDGWIRRADPVRRFVERELVIGGSWTRATELHDAYGAWLARHGDKMAESPEALGRRLTELQITSKRRSEGVFYHAALKSRVTADRRECSDDGSDV